MTYIGETGYGPKKNYFDVQEKSKDDLVFSWKSPSAQLDARCMVYQIDL